MHLTWKTNLNKGTRATRWMWAGGESTGNNSLLAEALLFWELEDVQSEQSMCTLERQFYILEVYKSITQTTSLNIYFKDSVIKSKFI